MLKRVQYERKKNVIPNLNLEFENDNKLIAFALDRLGTGGFSLRLGRLKSPLPTREVFYILSHVL